MNIKLQHDKCRVFEEKIDELEKKISLKDDEIKSLVFLLKNKIASRDSALELIKFIRDDRSPPWDKPDFQTICFNFLQNIDSYQVKKYDLRLTNEI